MDVSCVDRLAAHSADTAVDGGHRSDSPPSFSRSTFHKLTHQILLCIHQSHTMSNEPPSPFLPLTTITSTSSLHVTFVNLELPSTYYPVRYSSSVAVNQTNQFLNLPKKKTPNPRSVSLPLPEIHHNRTNKHPHQSQNKQK